MEAILIYHGPSQPTVLALGLTDQFADLLLSSVDSLPDRFYCHYQARQEGVFERSYESRALGDHLKMSLKNNKALEAAPAGEGVVRLDRSREAALRALFERAYPDSYFDTRMLDTGKFFGLQENDALIAVAGIHVYSREYRVAALGNIATHPDYRGQGLAGKLTACLTRELVNEGLTVTLNVAADNEPAIRCYSRLGFERTHEYREAEFIRRSPGVQAAP
jgi:ribosomal protein S18 acetylase RimI-like enzyme